MIIKLRSNKVLTYQKRITVERHITRRSHFKSSVINNTINIVIETTINLKISLMSNTVGSIKTVKTLIQVTINNTIQDTATITIRNIIRKKTFQRALLFPHLNKITFKDKIPPGLNLQRKEPLIIKVILRTILNPRKDPTVKTLKKIDTRNIKKIIITLIIDHLIKVVMAKTYIKAIIKLKINPIMLKTKNTAPIRIIQISLKETLSNLNLLLINYSVKIQIRKKKSKL